MHGSGTLRRSLVLVAVVGLAVTAAAVPAGGVAGVDSPGGTDGAPATDGGPTVDDRPPSAQTIEELYPNPRASGDPGEYVVLQVPAETNTTGWSIVDDAGHEAGLPNETLSGRVVFSPEPEEVASVASDEVYQLDGQLRLADAGDAIELRSADGTVLDEASYDRAPEAERFVRDGDDWAWQAVDATGFDPVSFDPGGTTAFVLPDSPDIAFDEFEAAEDRLLLGGYTLTSDRVVEALVDATGRGVEVRVLLEGSPVGGTSEAQVEALDRLDAAGVSVTLLSGATGRYATHHPKYAVVDDRAIVTSENWKPAGIGGRASRGWGVVLDDRTAADHLQAVFVADETGRSATSWEAVRGDVDPVEPDPATGTFEEHHSPESVDVESARLLLAPDNAAEAVLDLLRSAEDSLRIQQVTISGLDDPLLAATVDAARNGTAVQIGLSDAWYVEEENRRLVAELDALADREDLPIEASLIDGGDRFARTHVKGVIVDDEHVLVGSLNWNPTALEANREVLVHLRGEDVAAYYADVFAADVGGAGRNDGWRVPVGLGAAVASAWLVVAGVVLGRIRWRR